MPRPGHMHGTCSTRFVLPLLQDHPNLPPYSLHLLTQVGNMIFNTVEGTIAGARGTAEYDEGNLVAIAGTLDANTIQSGNTTRDSQ